MSDYFEIDFTEVESSKSGDAITIRYSVGGQTTIHVVDAGFVNNGANVVRHIKQYYGNASRIDHVVATHPDGDHAGGLRSILEEFEVGTLWMNRPWLYVDELIPRFTNYTSKAALAAKLKDIYLNIAKLEEIATGKGVEIREAFQGTAIGSFIVASPMRSLFLDMVVESEKTPESAQLAAEEHAKKLGIAELLKRAANLVMAAWGIETFSTDETSAENEMSIVQFARLNDQNILLTADAGRRALRDAVNYLASSGVPLPGFDIVQVPHHGSRRNVNSELLNDLLGSKHSVKPNEAQQTFSAVVCAAKDDCDHPRKAVVRAFWHRGARVVSTEGVSWRFIGGAAPIRHNYGPRPALPYPDHQEQD